MEKYDIILSEKLKEERKAEAKANAESFNKSILIGDYENLNLNFDEGAMKG